MDFDPPFDPFRNSFDDDAQDSDLDPDGDEECEHYRNEPRSPSQNTARHPLPSSRPLGSNTTSFKTGSGSFGAFSSNPSESDNTLITTLHATHLGSRQSEHSSSDYTGSDYTQRALNRRGSSASRSDDTPPGFYGLPPTPGRSRSGPASNSSSSGSPPRGRRSRERSRSASPGPSAARPLAAIPINPPSQFSGDFATLLWAPRNHRKDIKPVLRYFVEGWRDGGSIESSIKYLELDQDPEDGFNYKPGFFARKVYTRSEPLTFPGGFWNIADVSFVKDREEVEEKKKDNDKDSDKDKDKDKKKFKPKYIYYVWARIYGEKRNSLPEFEPEAIWAEKPVLEYVKLTIEADINLENVVQSSVSDRIRVVTHDDINNGKTKMVMKICPSPMCSTVGLEREMMAYRAFDGKDITPKFVGHVAEEGRVIGFVTEYMEGAHHPEGQEEKRLCREALERCHQLTGWHRNPMASHKSNFIIKDDKAYLVDLAKAYTPQDVASMGDEWVREKV